MKAGKPSARSIARDLGDVSHTTVAALLTGRRIASWEIVRRVILHLGGDEAEFLDLWTQAVNDTPVEGVHGGLAPLSLEQLPAMVAGFTGRESELAEIAELLNPARDAATVMVSAVAGLAGVGKTALVIQAAHAARKAGWFPGGVLFLDLHGYDDAPVKPGQALDALLRALGVAADLIPPDTDERAGLYRSALAKISAPILIIVDNASSEAQVRPLLPGSGSHKVLVTSRHTLAGLGARLLDVAVLDEESGVALLDHALRAARPGDDRITSDRAGAIRLASVCGGLPLALQITAALLKADPSRGVSDMADELTDEIWRLEALQYDDGSKTNAPSVPVAFELSYRQLDEAAARMFRLLAISPGPDISTSAAAALADIDGRAARRGLEALARAHLLDPGSTFGRWRMHDLLRLYAGRLSDVHADMDSREQARDRLLHYYLATARAADDHLRALPGTSVPAAFISRDSALAWLDAERPNLIATVTIAARTGRDEIAMQLPLELGEYFSWRRCFDEWLETAMTCRDAARRLNDTDNEAAALNNLGLALVAMRRFEDAIASYQDAAAKFRQTGNRYGEGMALGNLGVALAEVGQFDEAISAQQDAVTIFRQTSDRDLEGTALGNLGVALAGAGRLEEAITAYQDAATILRQTGDRHGEGQTLNNLGNAYAELRRLEAAIIAQRDAAMIFQEFGDRHGEGQTLNNLGTAYVELRRPEEAIACFQESLAIYRETADQHGEGMALGNLGVALAEVGRLEEAITAHQNAATILRETGDRRREGMVLDNLDVTNELSAVYNEQNSSTIQQLEFQDAMNQDQVAFSEMQQYMSFNQSRAASIGNFIADTYNEMRGVFNQEMREVSNKNIGITQNLL